MTFIKAWFIFRQLILIKFYDCSRHKSSQIVCEGPRPDTATKMVIYDDRYLTFRDNNRPSLGDTKLGTGYVFSNFLGRRGEEGSRVKSLTTIHVSQDWRVVTLPCLQWNKFCEMGKHPKTHHETVRHRDREFSYNIDIKSISSSVVSGELLLPCGLAWLVTT